jgi:RNA polymerase sigma factor (sigma-70 family)
MVAHRRRLCRLAQAEWDDVWQEMHLVFAKAIQEYRRPLDGVERGCCFRSYLWDRAWKRLANYLRSRLRYERHLERSVVSTRALDAQVEKDLADRRLNFWEERESNDPAAQAIWHEALKQVQQEIARLTGRWQQLWSAVATGTSAEDGAQELGVSERTFRRWRRRLLAHLRKKLTRALG